MIYTKVMREGEFKMKKRLFFLLQSLRKPGSDTLCKLKTRGGFVEIRDIFTVYTEDAEWISGE